MNIAKMRAIRANIWRALELSSHEIREEVKDTSPELRKAFDDVEIALELLYARMCHEIVGRSRNG